MRTFIMALMAAVLLAGAAAAADNVIPNRLAKAKAGEWVMLQDTAGPNAGEKEKFTVAEFKGTGDDMIIVLKRERYDAEGKVSETKDMEINLAKYAARLAELEDKAKQISRERLTLNNTEFTLWAVTWDRETESGTHEFKIWLSDQIPVGGFFKSWSSDPTFPAAELVDFGG